MGLSDPLGGTYPVPSKPAYLLLYLAILTQIFILTRTFIFAIIVPAGIRAFEVTISYICLRLNYSREEGWELNLQKDKLTLATL